MVSAMARTSTFVDCVKFSNTRLFELRATLRAVSNHLFFPLPFAIRFLYAHPRPLLSSVKSVFDSCVVHVARGGLEAVKINLDILNSSAPSPSSCFMCHL